MAGQFIIKSHLASAFQESFPLIFTIIHPKKNKFLRKGAKTPSFLKEIG
jgi:hypothetical protein